MSTEARTAGPASRRTTRRVRSGIAEWLGLAHFDLPLAGAAIGLAAISVGVLAAATRGDIPGDPGFYARRQAVYVAIGLIAMLAVARVDYSRFRELRIGVYTLMCTIIALVFVFGITARGSRRSFDLPLFSFQPAELGKYLLVLALAGFVLDGVRRSSDVGRTVRYLALGLFPALLVFLQPDLGTSLIFAAVTLTVIFLAGAPRSHMIAILGVAVASIGFTVTAAPSLGVPGLQDYQVERLTSFLHPSQDPDDAGYQQNQAMIAIGSGERTGRGDQATQTQLAFVPERQTDFIFAVIGERYGFLGAALVLSLYALLIWRALRIVTLSRNAYGALVAGGIAVALFFQVFVNIGMNLGVTPITGLPLPLMSFGGSQMVSTLLAVGILQSVHMHSRLDRIGN